MVSRPLPQKKERRSPIGLLILVVLLLASAWLNHAFRHPHTATEKPIRKPMTHPVYLLSPLPQQNKLPALPFTIGETSGVLWNLNTHQLIWQLNPIGLKAPYLLH